MVLLACRLLYGSGLRLLECLHLRVKDIEFERNEITVRDGILDHLAKVRRLHENDPRQGLGVKLGRSAYLLCSTD